MWVVMIYNDKMKGRKATKCPVSLWNCVALKSILYMNTGLYFLQNAQLGRSMIWLVQDKSNLKISHLIKMRPSSKKKIHSDLKFWPWADANLSYFHEICKFEGSSLQFFGLVVWCLTSLFCVLHYWFLSELSVCKHRLGKTRAPFMRPSE